MCIYIYLSYMYICISIYCESLDARALSMYMDLYSRILVYIYTNVDK